MSYLATGLMKQVFNGTAMAPPAQLWLGLLTENGEVEGNGYARVNVTGGFSQPDANGSNWNLNQINFPTPAGPWGVAIGAAIFDAQTDGNLLAVYVSGQPVSIPAQAPVYFNPGTLQASIRLVALT